MTLKSRNFGFKIMQSHEINLRKPHRKKLANLIIWKRHGFPINLTQDGKMQQKPIV